MQVLKLEKASSLGTSHPLQISMEAASNWVKVSSSKKSQFGNKGHQFVSCLINEWCLSKKHVPLETYIFILIFSLHSRSEQLRGAPEMKSSKTAYL